MKVVLLHNLCTYNLEPNSKDNSEYAVLCSLLRGSTGFFAHRQGMGSPWVFFGYRRCRFLDTVLLSK